MTHGTPIEWTHMPGRRGETWNPVSGCSVSSPGCTNCYAMKLAGTRLKHHYLYEGVTTAARTGPVFNGVMRAAPDCHKVWTQPLRWRKPRAIFVGDMCDLFHPNRGSHVIDRVFAVMAMTPRHIYFVLTKHPERMRGYCRKFGHQNHEDGAAYAATEMGYPNAVWALDLADGGGWCLPNVWMGVSAENQEWAEKRIPVLLDTPAAVRFVSAEPLLGPLDLRRFMRKGGLDWVVTGGESGPRPPHPDWFRWLRDHCTASGATFFFKQWGHWSPIRSPIGTWIKAVYPDGWTGDFSTHSERPEVPAGQTVTAMYGVGKKAAGHELDGEVCRAWPDHPGNLAKPEAA